MPRLRMRRTDEMLVALARAFAGERPGDGSDAG